MCRNISFFTFLDVSYTKSRRVRLSYLPAHLTLVGCYGSEKKLIDCAHHDYTSSTSMDISISCISSNNGSRNESVNGTIISNINTDSSSSDEFNSLSEASLFLAIICLFVVIIFVIVLIIFIRRSRKHAQRYMQWIVSHFFSLWKYVHVLIIIGSSILKKKLGIHLEWESRII